MKWQANVISIDNGFVVEYIEGGSKKKKIVYEEKEDGELYPNELNKEHIMNMFYDLLEFFGNSGSKHDKKRIRITYGK